MRILWLTWRDLKNPASGGAEKVAIETAARLVKNGNRLTIYTSAFKNSKAKDEVRGVKIERQGNRLTCRFYAAFKYLKNKNDFDIVIDEINTLPFFTPLYTKKAVAFIHQLAKEYWFRETFFPINIIGSFLEPLYLKLYKKIPTMTISNSTRNDLEALGFKKIKVIRLGINIRHLNSKSKSDLILFIGRLKPAKNAKDAIEAFKLINSKFKNYELKIIGSGEGNYVKKLKSKVKSLKLTKSTEFCGYLDEKTKISFLKKAKLILIPSIREGWSLVATEANATDCVPIAYDVPGLQDSVINGKTGILTPKDPQLLAEAAISLLKNDNLRQKLAQNGLKFAKNFSWDNTYQDVKSFLPKRI